MRYACLWEAWWCLVHLALTRTLARTLTRTLSLTLNLPPPPHPQVCMFVGASMVFVHLRDELLTHLYRRASAEEELAPMLHARHASHRQRSFYLGGVLDDILIDLFDLLPHPPIRESVIHSLLTATVMHACMHARCMQDAGCMHLLPHPLIRESVIHSLLTTTATAVERRPPSLPFPYLTSPHLTSPHLISPHLTSCHLTSSHTSPHLTSCHLTSSHTSPHTSPHLILPHLTSPYLTLPHLTSSYLI